MRRFLAFLLALCGLALAQFDPSRGWSTIRSENFDIHFHPGLERLAPEAAIYAEQAYAILKAEFEPPPGRISIVLSDVGENLNGFANPTNNVVGIFTAQFRSSEIFNPRLGSWWQTIIFHEIAHMFDLSQTRGAIKERTRILGQLPAQSAVKPWPFIEGTAVYMKYKHLGESRLNDSMTRMAIRQMVLSGKFPTLNEIRQNYTKRDWPYLGFLVYNYSAWLVRYLEVRFGPDAYKRFSDANGGLVSTKDFNQPFQQAFGVSLDQVYDDFVRWLPSQFESEIASIRQNGVTQTEKLSSFGFFAGSPSNSENGLIYHHQSTLRNGLRVIKDGQERELFAGEADSAQWSPDGKQIIYTASGPTNPYNSNADLYQFDLATGQRKALTDGERVYFARYAPDGKSIFIAKNSPDGSTALARYFTDVDKVQPLRDFPHQDGVIHSFAVAPNGQFLVLSLLRRGGFQDLYRYVPQTGELTALTQDKTVDADPVFSPDGRYVIYSSDINRVYNLYAYRLDDGATFQITNVLTGAFAPTLSPDRRRIVFTGYEQNGYNLYQIPYNPDGWKRVEVKRETLPTFQPVEATSSQPYNPFNYLAPLYWLPSGGLYLDSTGFGGNLGVSFSASDPIGIHAYSVAAGFDGYLRGVSYDMSYQYSGFGLPIILRAGGLGSENAQSVGTRFWSPGGNLEVQYLRTDEVISEINAGRTTTTNGFTLRLNQASGTANDLYRTRNALSIVGSAFNYADRPDWYYNLRGALGVQVRLPTEAPQVLSFRVAGGFTTSPLKTDALDLGYLPYISGSLPVLNVRGFAIGQLSGNRALAASLEYRLPPWNIEQGLGNWPLFFDDLGLTVFADAGVAGKDTLDFSQTRFSLGAEIRLSMTLLWLAPGSSLALGVAQGIGEPGARFYLNLNVPIPTITGGMPVRPELELPADEP
jgi:Tol biopolymer transport system component